MELLAMYWKELIQLSVFGGAVAGVALFALAKGIDMEKFDSNETRIFIREKEFGEK